MSVWTKTCPVCGGTFEPRRFGSSRYCSSACRQKAYRRRVKAAKAKPARKHGRR